MDIIGKSAQRIPTVVVFLGLLAPSCESTSELKLGATLNIFKRFGFMSNSMRVVHRSGDTAGWIFKEPTNDVFQTFGPIPRPPSVRSRGQVPAFEGDLQMVFCDDARQLLQAYFQDFTVERMEKPWSIFSSSWNQGDCAQNMGIDPTYFGDSYSYVLVQLSRPRTTARMTSSQQQQIRLEEIIEAEVIPGNITSVQMFFNDFGTHYIGSFSTGDSLYQVCVYQKALYKRIKNRFQAEGVASITSAELVSYFSPSYAYHTGKILSASGNLTIQAWAAEQLKLPSFVFSFPCLVYVHTNPALLQALDGFLKDEAILQLHLRSLESAFDSAQRRLLFREVLDNQLELWGTNMFEECFSRVNNCKRCFRNQGQFLKNPST